MKAAINNLRSKRSEEGFTLVELLVVVVIIGVLVAIAIPMYGSYRKGAANKSAQSDVRGAITAVEQYYSENANKYPPSTAGTLGVAVDFKDTTQTGNVPQKATVSPGNTLSFVNKTDTYYICAVNSDGGTVYVYNTADGKSVHKSAGADLATCVSNGL